MAKVLIGGIVAGIVIFFWGFAAHKFLPLGETGMHDIPQEEVVAAAVKDAVREPGIYFLPGHGMGKTKSPEEQKALNEKVAKGPTGFLIIHPKGSEVSLPKYLVPQLATNVVCGLLAALLVTQLRPGFVVRCLVRHFDGNLRFRDGLRAVLELVRISTRLHHRPGHRTFSRLVPRRFGHRGHRASGPSESALA